VEHVYAQPSGTQLKAYVFSPDKRSAERRPAIVLFHGGGWTMGEPSWAFSRARHFAERGMVAVAVQYRLSDQREVTPHEAMADARAVIRWVRLHADSLDIDPKRVVGYGWSAGGHLAASAAIFGLDASGDSVSSRPDALVLVCPAVSLVSDGWVQRLLRGRGTARDISPDEHVRKGVPPTLILQGNVDTVTPMAGAKRFCERMRAAGNVCELHVYEGFGHLFTPAGTPDHGMPQPDQATSEDASKRADRFLEALGFLK
jgi:acetyl esterase/lipase